MRWLAVLIVLVAFQSTLGCSLCCSPYDLEYATYGTRTPRIDQQAGRVGSPFSDPELMGSVVQASAGSYEVIESEYPESVEVNPPMLEQSELYFEPLQ